MRFVSPMLDMRYVLPPFASALLLCAATGVVPARAQATASPACVAATGPDVSPATGNARDASAARAAMPTPVDSGARAAANSTNKSTNPTVRLLASVEAAEVRFASQPQICVRLRGDATLDSVHVLARRNIRSPVTTGTTYRNVYVAVEILGHLNADCIAARITGQPANGSCASLDLRDSTSRARVAPSREGTP